MKSRTGAWVAVWLLAAVYYFYQYTLRAAPAVMLPELSGALGLSAAGVASLVGLFYFGYAPFSLVAGTAIDRMGARAVIPAGALMVGAGALLFGTGNLSAAYIGRFMQGAGGVFALVGAVYIVSKHFPPSRGATLIGVTQMFGASGGSAGQFLVAPMIAGGVLWSSFWIGMGLTGLLIAAVLFVLLPREKVTRQDDWVKGSATALSVVFKNPQSLLCGAIAGLLFMPTTILDMVWGVRFLQEGHGFDYGEAVLRSATVPLGWMIGSPLLGVISDKIGRRKPVIAGAGFVLLLCLAWILYGRPGIFPPYVLGLVTGLASGSAMLTYTIIREVNPPQYGGTTTGAISLMNFGISALAGPVFGSLMQGVSQGRAAGLVEYQMTFKYLLYGVALAIALSFALRETGAAVQVAAPLAEAA